MNKILIVLGLIFITALGSVYLLADANAQEVQVSNPVSPEAMNDDFTKRFNPNTGLLTGPLDVVITPTDKGSAGQKYSNVPFVQIMGAGVIIFPSGDKGKDGKPVFVYAINWTLYTK